MGFFDKDKLMGSLNKAKDSVVKAGSDIKKAASDTKKEMDADKAPLEGAIIKYDVIYLGGLAEYSGKQSGSIGLNVMPDEFYFKKGYTSKKWFNDFSIPYEKIKNIDIVERTISNTEMLLSGSKSDMKSLEQKNNIEITYINDDGNEVLLRLEMLTGVSVYGQAGKCREFMDILRQNGILNRFQKEESNNGSAGGDDIAAQLKKIAELHDMGILDDDEFNKKKSELLARM